MLSIALQAHLHEGLQREQGVVHCARDGQLEGTPLLIQELQRCTEADGARGAEADHHRQRLLG